MTTYKHILVPVDESPISYAAVEQALALAKELKSEVTVMSVISVDPFKGVEFYKVAPAITDYFMQAESDSVDVAFKKLKAEDIEMREIQLVRLKFLSEVAN